MQQINQPPVERQSKASVHSMSALLKKGFSLILILIVILASVNIFQLNKTKQQLNTLVFTNIQKMTLGSIMRDSIRLRSISMYKMLETEDYFERDEEISKFFDYAAEYRKARDKQVSLGITELEKQLDKKITEQIKIAQPLARSTVDAMLSGLPTVQLRKKVSHTTQNQEKLYDLLNQLNSLQKNQSNQALKDVDENVTYIIILTIIITAIVIFLSIQIGLRLYRHVIKTSKVLEQKNIDINEAYIKAEESTQIKSEFLAKMSHEIRTPMNGVMGMLQLLLTEELTPSQKDYAETAFNSSQALLTIINDILDFSKMEAGKLDFSNAQFSLSSTMNTIIATVENSAQEKHLNLNYFIKSNVEEYYVGDASRISQIFINLIGNAIKFTEKGGVDIIISLKESDDNNSLLYVEICDTGIGISEEAKSKLFMSFNQADNSISRNYGGTGLGLAISKQLCTLMGGDIGIYDGENGGSVFWFTLNLIRVEDQQNSCEALNTIKNNNIESLVDNIENSLASNGSILIVEDKEVNQSVAHEILKKLNYSSDIAENGKVATEKVLLKKYDLILMDCHMPYMDGFEATHIIRKLQSDGNLSQCPIIALTGNAMKGDKEKCLEAGMDDFLAKPFKMTELSNMIKKWLN